MGVKKEDVDACLKITPRLREVGLTAERVVEILDSDDTEDGRKFVARYRAISKSDRAYLSIEEICVAAGLTTRRLWEVISGARLEQSQEAVKLMVADAQPRIMATAIKAATTEVPIMDREGNVASWTYGDPKATELIWKATGMLPTPKGATTTINFQPSLPISVDDETDDGPSLPGMDEVLREIQQVTAAPQLPAPREELVIQNAEFEDVDVR